MADPEALKEHGNACFSKGKLDAAIDAYSEAICLNPNNPVYHTNRCVGHLSQRKLPWRERVRMCVKAYAWCTVCVRASLDPLFGQGDVLPQEGGVVAGGG